MSSAGSSGRKAIRLLCWTLVGGAALFVGLHRFWELQFDNFGVRAFVAWWLVGAIIVGCSSGFARTVGHLLAWTVACVFLAAAWGKIWEPRQFAMDISNYKIVPEYYINLMAIFLPWWEVGAAIALARPRSRPAGAVLIIGMLIMFISAVSYAALYKGLHISCGCWGKAGAASAGWKTIGLDAGLLIATILSLVLAPLRRPGAGYEVVAVSPTPAHA